MLNLLYYNKIKNSLGKNGTQISKKIGVSRQTLHRVVTHRAEPGHAFMKKFKAAYPEIDFELLFFGGDSDETK